jgi:LCP family protein required for cell wall assembly
MRTKTIKAVLVAIVVVAVVVVAFVLASRFETSRDVAPEGAGTAASISTVREDEEDVEAVSPLEDDSEEVETIYYDGRQYMKNENLSTLLIMGIDDEEFIEVDTERNESLADFLLLAVFDRENKTCTLVQLNRDTMCTFPTEGLEGSTIQLGYGQICMAYNYGSGMEDSCENTVYAVSRLLYDATIDNYFTVTMGAVPALNDLAGGVTVTIEDDFTGVDDTLVQGETVTLMGEHALNFVRARYSMVEDGTNLNRMSRQRTYMTGLMSALQDKVQGDPMFLLNMYSALADDLLTDCSLDELTDYASMVSEYDVSDIIVPEGEAVKGELNIEFYVDEDALQQLVVDLFYIPVDA